jgi:hypothetical protein
MRTILNRSLSVLNRADLFSIGPRHHLPGAIGKTAEKPQSAALVQSRRPFRYSIRLAVAPHFARGGQGGVALHATGFQSGTSALYPFLAPASRDTTLGSALRLSGCPAHRTSCLRLLSSAQRRTPQVIRRSRINHFRSSIVRTFRQSRRPIVSPSRLEKPQKNPNREALFQSCGPFRFSSSARRILQHSKNSARRPQPKALEPRMPRIRADGPFT